jgi:hypothetical protein
VTSSIVMSSAYAGAGLSTLLSGSAGVRAAGVGTLSYVVVRVWLRLRRPAALPTAPTPAGRTGR